MNITTADISAIDSTNVRKFNKCLTDAKFYVLCMQEIADGIKYNAVAMTHVDAAKTAFEFTLNGKTLPMNRRELIEIGQALAIHMRNKNLTVRAA